MRTEENSSQQARLILNRASRVVDVQGTTFTGSKGAPPLSEQVLRREGFEAIEHGDNGDHHGVGRNKA